MGGQRSRYDAAQRQIAAEQQRQNNLAAYLTKADDCLNSQKLDCTQSALDSARSLAANSSERDRIGTGSLELRLLITSTLALVQFNY